MTDSKKKGFSWSEGEVLSEKNSTPLGDVRQHGLPKVAKAPAHDPQIRREEREKFLDESQNKPYKPSDAQKAQPEVIVQESSSDISGEFEDSEVRRLTDKGNKFRGLDRFGKK